jgi:hypothetical protein
VRGVQCGATAPSGVVLSSVARRLIPPMEKIDDSQDGKMPKPVEVTSAPGRQEGRCPECQAVLPNHLSSCPKASRGA